MKIAMTIAAVATAGMLASGCTTTEQRAAAGAAIGGGVAAAAGANTGGIAAATVAGAGAGVLLDTLDDGRTCRYRRPDGSTYIARCP